MDFEPLALDTCNPSKGFGLNDPLPTQPGSKRLTLPKWPRNHLPKRPTFETLYRSTLMSKYVYAISVPDVIRI